MNDPLSRSSRCIILTLTAALLCACVASTPGCGSFGSQQSQLFGHTGKYQAANVNYRIEQAEPGSGTPGARRTLTLAVRYPHPAGRAGYARVECIIQRPSDSTGENKFTAMFKQVRRLTDDNLPGVALGDGVQEAMGLDVPIAQLEHVLVELERAPVGAVPSLSASRVEIAGTINGVAVPPRAARIAELDRLAARVRRDGGLISAQQVQTQLAAPATAIAAPVTPPVVLPPASPAIPPTTVAFPPAAAHGSPAIVPTSFAEPVVRRLPGVDVLLR